MNKIEISSFKEIGNLKGKLQENKFTIDLSNCENKERVRVVDFFAGLTFFNGAICKLTKDEFEITINKECD